MKNSNTSLNRTQQVSLKVNSVYTPNQKSKRFIKSK